MSVTCCCAVTFSAVLQASIAHDLTQTAVVRTYLRQRMLHKVNLHGEPSFATSQHRLKCSSCYVWHDGTWRHAWRCQRPRQSLIYRFGRFHLHVPSPYDAVAKRRVNQHLIWTFSPCMACSHGADVDEVDAIADKTGPIYRYGFGEVFGSRSFDSTHSCDTSYAIQRRHTPTTGHWHRTCCFNTWRLACAPVPRDHHRDLIILMTGLTSTIVLVTMEQRWRFHAVDRTTILSEICQDINRVKEKEGHTRLHATMYGCSTLMMMLIILYWML